MMGLVVRGSPCNTLGGVLASGMKLWCGLRTDSLSGAESCRIICHSSVTLDKAPNLSKPQSFHICNE